MFLHKGCKHFIENLFILTSIWLNNAHIEPRWNTESEDAINECSHYFKMHMSLEKLLEIVEAHIQHLSINFSQFTLIL